MVCKSAPASPTDEAVLLLWYKGDSAYPIHGVDRRENSEGTVASASRGTDPRYSVRDDHHLTALTIHKIRKEDEGQYRCRIDYRVGSTTNKFMKLIVSGRLFSNTLDVIILFSLLHPNRNILWIFHGFQLLIVTLFLEPSVCHLPQSIGNCYQFRERWHFNAVERKCQRFYYSGCGGNDNNFATFIECEKQCQKTSDKAHLEEFNSG